MGYYPSLPHYDAQRLESTRHYVEDPRLKLGKDNLQDQRNIWLDLAVHQCCFPPMFKRQAFPYFQYGHVNPVTINLTRPLEKHRITPAIIN